MQEQAWSKILPRLSPSVFIVNWSLLVEDGCLERFMLAAWKDMHPTDEYLKKYTDLFYQY
jgi:hypothetical protein